MSCGHFSKPLEVAATMFEKNRCQKKHRFAPAAHPTKIGWRTQREFKPNQSRI